MLRKLEKAVDCWGGSHTLIDTWLESRRQLLIHYCQLVGLPPYNKQQTSLPEEIDIKQFCNQLMDYVSAGHFEVYDQVISSCGSDINQHQSVLENVFPLISNSTDAALDFNDKYTNGLSEEMLLELDQDLSHLGEKMEERFELEDKMLEMLFQHHSIEN